MLQHPQWMEPGAARSDGRLYYLIFENRDDEQMEHAYFRSLDGDWYCLDSMGKAPAKPIAAIPF